MKKSGLTSKTELPISPTKQTDDSHGKPFDGFIVAVGASAGGLEALERFFSHCPPDSGAAFVVIQHLSPDHKSMMHDLLGRYTKMKVCMVEDGMPIQPDQVHLIPPGTIMRITSGRFQLTPKSPHLLTLPIDIFLNALADDHGARSIGVILSGTGSDGTRGAVAINAAGGLLLAQEPRDAKFDGMPSSVIATGLVDAVMPVDALPARMLAHIHNQPIEALAPASALLRMPLSREDALEGILHLLLQASGIDFHDYKPGTLLRRIERRMQVRHTPSLDEYLVMLESDRTELATLRRELLIPVTSFFRDSEAFDTLAQKAVLQLVEDANSGDSIRVWIAGTSTGEEAYSIAMLFMEAFEKARRWPNLKVFATDVSQQNIEFAAMGQYPDSAAAELTSERLERFFVRTGGNYTVKPELRQCIVFARHNLLIDPPFTRMSLVSCRNTLIYFNAEAQKRALLRLQYAIQPHGFLFLGSSESLVGNGQGFTTVHSKHKLFRRSGASVPLSFAAGDSAARNYRGEVARVRRVPASSLPVDESAFIDEATATLLGEYAPPSMLINERHEAVHLFGKVKPYFHAREGSASLELSRILPDNLVPVASALLFKAAKEHERMVSDLMQVTLDNGSQRRLRLSVRPLQSSAEERLMLLSFEEQAEVGGEADLSAEPVDVDAETMLRMGILERELLATRESLQATIEELETSNEELQATNEELMASNEELQSSNEELQSVNEELNTVNAEFQEKVAILNRVNADLDTMAKAVGVATVFVDEQLNLTRFSPDAVGIFRLRDSDIGRPLEEIAHVLKYPGLIDEMRRTLVTERMIEREALAPDGRLFVVRILPYGVASSRTRGVVVTFVDVSAFRDRDRLQVIIDALPEHIAVLEVDGKIALVNDAWRRFACANGDASMSRSGVGTDYLKACQDDGSEDGRIATRAQRGVRAVLEGSSPGFSMQYPCHSPTEQRWFVMNVAPIRGHEFGAVVSHINITAWYAEGRGGADDSE